MPWRIYVSYRFVRARDLLPPCPSPLSRFHIIKGLMLTLAASRTMWSIIDFNKDRSCVKSVLLLLQPASQTPESEVSETLSLPGCSAPFPSTSARLLPPSGRRKYCLRLGSSLLPHPSSPRLLVPCLVSVPLSSLVLSSCPPQRFVTGRGCLTSVHGSLPS